MNSDWEPEPPWTWRKVMRLCTWADLGFCRLRCPECEKEFKLYRYGRGPGIAFKLWARVWSHLKKDHPGTLSQEKSST